MSAARHSTDLRDAVRSLAAAHELSASVRGEIGASWQRSARAGLQPDRFDVPYHPDLDTEGLLVRASAPVLEQLAFDFDGVNMSIVLTDSRAGVLDRRVLTRSLNERLDRILLAPGFVYAEESVGTNAIGTAVEQRAPSFVGGGEHFADALTPMACAAAPVTDSRTGRLLGVVDLTCETSDATPLMLPFIRRAARDIEQRIIEDARLPQQMLIQRFLHERRRARHPLVLLDRRVMVSNAAAERLVHAGDEPVLRDLAGRLLRHPRQELTETVVLHGERVVVSCEEVLDGGVEIAVLLHLQTDSARRDGSASSLRKPFGWESLTDTEQSVVALVTEGFTNRQIAERIFVSPYTVDSHLRSIFRKLGVRSRVDVTRVALDRRSLTVTQTLGAAPPPGPTA
jgi:sigma-54 dependent transcriptional regulator, acetoin dehydrogenase operon transcriptional activator AcoR